MQQHLDFSLPGDAQPAQGFHPAVDAWLKHSFGQPTAVQARAWEVTTQHRDALIAAPTGSGKTLAAFLSAINDLVLAGLGGGLAGGVQVLYVSPLKALSNDIQKNLQAPLAGIREQLQAMGLPDVPIRDAVRTGDTSQAERERMRRHPPHILVTTPESLYILLTSDAGRGMLGRVRTVIVDELHAVAGSKRGAHLMLSLERLEAVCAQPPVRIGLSATVKPLEGMAAFLIGHRERAVSIVDSGHSRARDLALQLPASPLTAVMATEVWGEIYDRLATLTAAHRTTLIFVNQRRLAERVARHLAERIGEAHVTAHHGSLAKEHRLAAEQRLKNGQLKALVATSSLELGIDIGDVDLVCQIGSPRAINAFLQRVGRSGHAVAATPKGRMFPLSLDDLLECAALLHAVQQGELDAIRTPPQPLDVLAQQIVGEVSCREWGLDALHAAFRCAQPYAELPLATFEQVVEMLAEGYSTRRGRRGAHLHYDAVNRVIRARRGAKLTAVTHAGVIPDQFDYDVVLLPEAHRIGSLNEDFAFESLPGDIFQLGNTSYRVLKIETGKVLVEDAHGLPPAMPFWFGEGLGRTQELSHAVSQLAESFEAQLVDGTEAAAAWLEQSLLLEPAAAQQLTQYLAAAQAALGALPNEHTVIFERFFDEVGDTHLVIHSPFGSRVNRAWGLALRKRFCRQFNFELQASALEDSIVLSLGPTHSFPLGEIKSYLKSATARDVLIQALLDAPMFATRWRWNATTALAIKRTLNGRRLPPQFQRSDAEDLLTVVFPDQVACAENLSGPREIPDHPLVRQTIDDCLHEVMDVDGFLQVLRGIESGSIRVLTCELASPSPLSHAILNARPFAFLDDGAAEERRTRAVRTQSLMEVQDAASLGQLDAAAIARVRAEALPEIGHPEELHDALVVHGWLTPQEMQQLAPAAPSWFQSLQQQQRASWLQMPDGRSLAVAAERLQQLLALFGDAPLQPAIRPVQVGEAEPGEALRELLRGRLELLGPVAEQQLLAELDLDPAAIQAALLELESQGAVMRGVYVGGVGLEWCDRRLLARIHRYTRERRRAEVQAVSPAQFQAFLFRWHRFPRPESGGGDARHAGEDSVLAVLRQLEGYAAPAGAWEEDLLRSRLPDYQPEFLDRLCASGRVMWYRPTGGGEPAQRRSGPIRSTPILLVERESMAHWQTDAEPAEAQLSSRADRALAALRMHGASFFSDLLDDSGLLPAELEEALGELAGAGLVTCDSFVGLRAIVMPADRRARLRRRMPRNALSLDRAGRWALTRRRSRTATDNDPGPDPAALAAPRVEHIAWVLLRRYGVVFRKLLEREQGLPPWRELFYVYRRLEARGEICGGRFVSGFSGEQFALPEAWSALRKPPETSSSERIAVSAVDPLNLLGILAPGDKTPRVAGNRVLYEGGVAVVVQTGGSVHLLKDFVPADEWRARNQLIQAPLAAPAPQRPG